MMTAEIPIFDLNGPTFLSLYGALMVLAAIWSFWRARTAVNRFDRKGYFPEISDPYDCAYLAAGAPRAAQLAVVRLMHSRHIEWKSGLSDKRLLPIKRVASRDLHPIEQKMLSAIEAGGRNGLRVAEAYTAVLPEMRALEARLASLGMRPTESERKQAGRSAVGPLIAVFLIGLVKLFVGMARDKPVGFLCVLLFITVVLALIAGSSTRRLTDTGVELLENLRNEKSRENRASGFEGVCWSFALVGPITLASIPEFAGMHEDLARHMGNSAAQSSSGGCGSSGCGGGSSGCGGGGGCGGCGGGGD